MARKSPCCAHWTRAAAGENPLQLDSPAGPYHDGPIQGFAIAGKDGRFQPAEAQWLDKKAGAGGGPDYDRSAIISLRSVGR
mgnify:CR=1 FL=1